MPSFLYRLVMYLALETKVATVTECDICRFVTGVMILLFVQIMTNDCSNSFCAFGFFQAMVFPYVYHHLT